MFSPSGGESCNLLPVGLLRSASLFRIEFVCGMLAGSGVLETRGIKLNRDPGDDMSEPGKSAVLLVEDDESDILLLRRAFVSLRIGNPLSEVRNGEEAIKYLSGSGRYADRNRYPLPLLMLLDLRMPKLSGFEVLEWIREQPHLRDLIVVVLTALDSVSDVNKAYSLGANSYLVKPDSFKRLMEMMETLGIQWLITPPSDINATPARFDQTKA